MRGLQSSETWSADPPFPCRAYRPLYVLTIIPIHLRHFMLTVWGLGGKYYFYLSSSTHSSTHYRQHVGAGLRWDWWVCIPCVLSRLHTAPEDWIQALEEMEKSSGCAALDDLVQYHPPCSSNIDYKYTQNGFDLPHPGAQSREALSVRASHRLCKPMPSLIWLPW